MKSTLQSKNQSMYHTLKEDNYMPQDWLDFKHGDNLMHFEMVVAMIFMICLIVGIVLLRGY